MRNVFSTGLYRQLDPSLPHMGVSPLGPARLTPEAIDAIHQCTDARALGDMLGYARSYTSALGGLIVFSAVALGAWMLGHETVAVAALSVSSVLAMMVVETRRSARKWEAAILARLLTLAPPPHTSGGSLPAYK